MAVPCSPTFCIHRHVQGNGGGRGGGVTSSASLLKQKGGGVKKPAKAPASQVRHAPPPLA